MNKVWSRAAAFAVLAMLLAGCGGAEDRKARYVEKGQEYFTERNYDKAGVEFRNALQIDPTDADARYQLGRVSEKLKNPREAVGHYQAAIDADPNHLLARAALGRLFLLGGLTDRAQEIIQPGLVQEQHAQLLTVRGGARAQLGNTEGAFEDAEAAVNAAPDDEYAIALLASLYRQSARSDKAIEVVRAGLEKLPDSVDLHVVLADLELAHERHDEAEAQLRKVIELQPEELTHRYRLARFYLMTKNVPAAERSMREAIEAEPDSVEAKVALVEMLAVHKGAQEAEVQLKTFAGQEKDGAKMTLALAQFHEQNNDPDAAESLYRKVIETLKLRPDGLTARSRLAASMLRRNEVDAAGKLIDEVLNENARDNDALILRGNMALARGDAPAAITDLRAVLRDQPNSIPVLRALARAHLGNNEVALAEETLQAAAQANPTDVAVRMDLAQLLLQSGRAQQARPILEQVLVQAPTNVAAAEALFKLQMSLSDTAGARVTAQNIKQARPDLPLGDHLQGVLEESQQKLDAAIEAYERALQIQPAAAEPLAALVRIDLARKRPEQATARLDKILAELPEHTVAHNLKGELLTSRGETAAALESFDASIRIAPQWWIPYRGRALARLGDQRNPEAKRMEDAIQSLEQGLSVTGAASIGTELAALYERAERPEDAIRVYEQMVSSEPNGLVAANNLAMLLVTYRSDQASLDRAQQLTDKLANVSEPAVLNTRGWVKFKRGEYQEALALLQQAVEKSPDSPVMRYHLGMTQMRLGDHDAARSNLEQAVASPRSFHGVQDARSALDEMKRAG